MLCSTIFNTKLFKETPERYIDANNDIYPNPYTFNMPSCKVYGWERLYYAVIYFQFPRVKQLLKLCQNDVDCDFRITDESHYSLNIIDIISLKSFPTGAHYSNNERLFESMFFMVLNGIKRKNRRILFASIMTQKDANFIPRYYSLLHNMSDRPHMLLALWNYGLQLEYTEILDDKFIKLIDKPGKSKTRYTLINDICPISLEPISDPAIYTDGCVYEYSYIKRHLLRSNKSPILNVSLNGILYMPKTSTFEQVRQCQ